MALEGAPRSGKCFGDAECSWRVRHKRQREPGAGLLIDTACEPLMATLEDPAEKPAIVNLGFAHAGNGINLGASEPLRWLSPQRLEWRHRAGRQLLFEAVHHHR